MVTDAKTISSLVTGATRWPGAKPPVYTEQTPLKRAAPAWAVRNSCLVSDRLAPESSPLASSPAPGSRSGDTAGAVCGGV